MKLLIPAAVWCVLFTFFAAFPLAAGETLSRREAARLAAKKAEEATRNASGAGAGANDSGPAQPAAKPVAVDEKHVEIVKDATLRGAGDLIGKRYALQEIDGVAVEKDVDAFVEWRSGTAMGGRLCNLFRAQCSFENSVVKGEPLPAATKMACADESMGKVEKRFFDALRLGMSFLAIGDFLELRRDDLVLRFELTEDAPGKAGGASEESDGEQAEDADAGDDAGTAESESAEDSAGAKGGDASGAEAEANAAPGAPVSELKPVSEEDLLDRKFILSKVDGEEFAVAAPGQPFIEFGEGMRVGGSACNVFTGLGDLRDGKLIVANAVATRKMCINPKLSEFERDFHALLREGAGIVVDGHLLILTGGGKTLEFVEEQ